ncbi:hypothetical protein VaNZ11_001035 [Volvox africanus]|uniref:Uncharacterized protein n=1 Tax=Volvox africanus TaxID=51714 RepID=A0ABQ5RNU8_9CHLO|nr:hypothetical protein VaNZ11_001035 [Volvox africanus]
MSRLRQDKPVRTSMDCWLSGDPMRLDIAVTSLASFASCVGGGGKSTSPVSWTQRCRSLHMTMLRQADVTTYANADTPACYADSDAATGSSDAITDATATPPPPLPQTTVTPSRPPQATPPSPTPQILPLTQLPEITPMPPAPQARQPRLSLGPFQLPPPPPQALQPWPPPPQTLPGVALQMDLEVSQGVSMGAIEEGAVSALTAMTWAGEELALLTIRGTMKVIEGRSWRGRRGEMAATAGDSAVPCGFSGRLGAPPDRGLKATAFTPPSVLPGASVAMVEVSDRDVVGDEGEPADGDCHTDKSVPVPNGYGGEKATATAAQELLTSEAPATSEAAAAVRASLHVASQQEPYGRAPVATAPYGDGSSILRSVVELLEVVEETAAAVAVPMATVPYGDGSSILRSVVELLEVAEETAAAVAVPIGPTSQGGMSKPVSLVPSSPSSPSHQHQQQEGAVVPELEGSAAAPVDDRSMGELHLWPSEYSGRAVATSKICVTVSLQESRNPGEPPAVVQVLPVLPGMTTRRSPGSGCGGR